ncbi:MAG: acyloxyacyl hydrolase [Terracidiphilus sp.]
MRKLLTALLILTASLVARAQTVTRIPELIYGGYSYFSNSFNGVPGAHNPLQGWDASAAFPDWHHLRFKIDVSGFTGTNLNAPQHVYFILGGAEYERQIRRERLFVHALFGDGGLNRNWGANGALGGTASFATVLGGGLDTPLNRHFALRVEGDMVHTNFALIESEKDPVPFRIPGLPTYFGRLTAGVVWMPKIATVRRKSAEELAAQHEPVEQELAFEDSASFGHYHIFAYTWWSKLQVSGIEYDRHSWGQFLGARMDYVAEVLPVVILRQPAKTDVFGDPYSQNKTVVPGLGITPIGLRLLWRDGRAWKPYYTIKGGMVGFTQKALSSYASYEDFSLQQSVGMMIRLNDRWDLRAGVSDFHFSNGFIVPNNPGIDEMMYQGALCYHLKSRRRN